MTAADNFSISKVIGGSLLVGGTAIGAGMLALPVVTGAGGFWPAIFMYFLCYIFSVSTGLLFLEVCLWMPKNANIVSMADHLLGKSGRMFAWIWYLFLFYCLTIAYVAAGGDFIFSLFQGLLPHFMGTILFTVIFGFFVYIGTFAVERINSLLMAGLVVSYIMFIIFGVSKVNLANLSHMDWIKGTFALPVIFTSFSYQGVIPSLTAYMDRNAKMMRLAILIGTSIPFFVYVIWELLTLGIVPAFGPDSLTEAYKQGQSAIYPLKRYLHSTAVYTISRFFAFFALTTSFLGVTLGLLDFLSDSLKIPKIGWKKVYLCAVIFVPPVIISLINPTIFLKALGYAGGIGCALLLGFLPALMAWVGRYKKGYPALSKQLPGGKVALTLLFIFVGLELIIEVLQEIFTFN
ncbi:MAG: aromatic amino acid transport family protein [Simkaniaceae bacterium]